MNPTKTIACTLGFIFVSFVAVQYNDPDPEVWMPIYGLAAAVCFWKAFGTPQPTVLLVLAAVYGIGAVLQWPPQWEGVLLNEIGMKTVNIELARESLGLGCCSLAFVGLSFLKNQ